MRENDAGDWNDGLMVVGLQEWSASNAHDLPGNGTGRSEKKNAAWWRNRKRVESEEVLGGGG